MTAAVVSDVGKRAGNEDSYYLPGQVEGLYIVADGMGGHNAGEVASQMAVSYIVAQVMLSRSLPTHERLRAAVQRANASIYERSCSRASMTGMGTTLTMAMVEDDHLTVAHVGDSRAYLLHEGKLIRLTHDHTLIEELMRAGQITREEAEVHPHRHVITRALGTASTIQVDIIERGFVESDILLLCSDGLTEVVDADDIEAVLSTDESVEKMAKTLVRMALSRGGQDNVTVLIAAGGDRP